MNPATALAAAGDLLQRTGFAARVHSAREAVANAWEPWTRAGAPDGVPARAVHVSSPGAALLQLLHQSKPVLADAVGPEEARILLRAGLCREEDGQLLPGPWQLSAFRGLLAVADSEYGSAHGAVHLGEDSLRFTAVVLDAAPSGTVVDVGSGSGVSTVAAARTATHVHALDILDRAQSATEVSAGLNGVGDRCEAVVADFRDFGLVGRVDTVIANLPGVPVPDGLPYPAAGNGGPDGLGLIRQMWAWFAESPGLGRLVMRFQCLGDADAPAALAELCDRFGHDHEVRVVTDSTVPVEVRDAITAARVAVQIGRPVEDVFARLAQERLPSGSTHFHCSTLVVARGPHAGVHYVPAQLGLDFTRVHRAAGGRYDLAELILAYARGLRLMPDEFWSIDGEYWASAVIRRIDDTIVALRDRGTSDDVAVGLLSVSGEPLGPTARAGAGLAVALLAVVLAERGLITSGPRRPQPS